MESFDNQLLNLFNDVDVNSALLKTIINNNIQKLLLDYQVLHVQNLVNCLKKNNIVLDTSDTGCGKTYCALATCKQLNLRPIIFCPKTIMNNWTKIDCEAPLNSGESVRYSFSKSHESPTRQAVSLIA